VSWRERFVIIAHRGASFYEPENTIAAFKRALELGADVIELDVRFSAEGIPVVVHDEDLSRLAGISKKIREMTLNEIRNVKVFGREPIPTLEEALEFIDRKAGVFIELKEVGLEDRVVEIVERLNLVDNVMIISFHLEALIKVRGLRKDIDVGLISSRRLLDLRRLSSLGVRALLLRYDVVTPMMVKEAHARGFKVFTWTINDVALAKRYVDYGVDGIATDRPDIRRELEKHVTMSKYGHL